MIVDTSAFIAGFDPLSTACEQFTVPLVEQELLEGNILKLRFRTAAESGRIKVKEPSPESLEAARISATSVGDTSFLSPADLQVLALAWQFGMEGYSPLIVSDDYSIQNVANQMGIAFVSLATFGIKKKWEWIRYCPACYRKYPADCTVKVCLVCGTNLKRKPLRKNELKTIKRRQS